MKKKLQILAVVLFVLVTGALVGMGLAAIQNATEQPNNRIPTRPRKAVSPQKKAVLVKFGVFVPAKSTFRSVNELRKNYE